MSLNDKVQKIETYLMEDGGSRGIAAMFPAVHGELSAACSQLVQSLSGTVLIITGFFIPDSQSCETDGPPGVAAVADLLAQLGCDVTVASTPSNFPVVDAALAATKELSPEITINSIELTEQLIDKARRGGFTTVMAVETPGQTADGTCRNMRAVEITESCLPHADPLFTNAPIAPTIAVGDGGNELGFGRLANLVEMNVEHGEVVACTSPADILVLGAVSNWACYAIANALYQVQVRRSTTKKPPAYPASLTGAGQAAIVDAVVAAGGVDGVTKEAVRTVDGLPWERHEEFLDGLERLFDVADKAAKKK